MGNCGEGLSNMTFDLDPCSIMGNPTAVGFASDVGLVCAAPSPPSPAAGSGPAPSTQKCWQNTGKISATLDNLGTDIEADVQNQFSAADYQKLTADINSDVAGEETAIGGGTTSPPYYIGGHFNLNITGAQIGQLSAADQLAFYTDFAGNGAGSDGVRRQASTGLAAAGGYTLHAQLGKNQPGIAPDDYSFHFDRYNRNSGLAVVGSYCVSSGVGAGGECWDSDGLPPPVDSPWILYAKVVGILHYHLRYACPSRRAHLLGGCSPHAPQIYRQGGRSALAA